MIQRKIKYTLSSLLVLGLSACTSEDLQGTFDRTADGPIEFTVGVEASPARRSLTREGETASSYYAMKAGTQVRLKVDGTWKGKTPEAISQKTTCTTVAAESGSDINALTFTEGETLYWDDYGTGDPENAENKAKGLSVLAVAVDGKAEAPVVDTDEKWQSLDWPVVTSGIDVLSGDILVSNNLIGDNAYKFKKPIAEHPGNLMFSHPLSKITINLTAADGFPTEIGTTKHKFENDPTVTLTNANTLAGMANNGGAYALTEGTISIASATAMPKEETKANVIAGTTSTTDKNITVIKQAIVYPGTQLGADNNAVIAVVQADGNVYFIKAAQIRAAMDRVGHTDYKTQAGYNYILNITLKKSGVSFTATVAKWNDVKSAEVDPKINVGDVYGTDGDAAFSKTFSFYRSTELDKGYSEDDKSTMSFANNSWTMSPQRYWPDHLTHYQFRGVWPETATDTNVSNAPRIETDTNGKQVIKVHNVAYTKDTYPSDLMIARPEIDPNKECTNKEVGHTPTKLYDGGICATEGKINLNFRYMMAQVEVNLATVTENDKKVNLNGATVELVGVYNGADVTLGSREVFPTGETGSYPLDIVSGEANKFLSAIVPQDLSGVKFRITVTNSDSTKDIYYADVAPILEEGKSTKIAPNGKWESGQHYVYNLKLSKTQVQVSATLTDWNMVTANENVWF